MFYYWRTMHYYRILFLLATLPLLTSTSEAQLMKYPLNRDGKKLSKKEVLSKITCYPSLISRWIQEKGYAKSITVEYAKYRFKRTDIGDTGGTLSIFKSGKALCEIELDLVPEIFFSSKDQLLILAGYGGSNSHLDLFSIKNKCSFLGRLYYTSDTGNDPDIEKILHEQSSGDYHCTKK